MKSSDAATLNVYFSKEWGAGGFTNDVIKKIPTVPTAYELQPC